MVNLLRKSESKEAKRNGPILKRPSKEIGLAGICECDICLRDLVKHFHPDDEFDRPAVNGVSFDLIQGEITALLGPSGCGKTTTLRLIAGFEHLDAGEIEIQHRIVAGKGIHIPPEKRQVGMVFQDYALFPHLTVADNVHFGLHTYEGDRKYRVEEVLELVGLHGLGSRMPHELSGGQQQRVALARALAPEPHLILLDEPFSNLDASLRTRVRIEVREILREANATAIIVTHDQEEALSLVDKVVIMMDGQVQQIATPLELYYKPSTRDIASFVGDANFLSGDASGLEVETELGRLSTLFEAKGRVDVMIRPENIRIRPAPSGSRGRVRDVLFFGHDQLVSIELNSGTTIESRLVGPLYQFTVGQPVEVEAVGPVMLYR